MYSDHELGHSDEDSHDKSVWTEADKVDGIGMVCEILPLFFAIYFITLGENPDTCKGFVYYMYAVYVSITSPPRYQNLRFGYKVVNFDLFKHFVALIEAVPMV